MDNMNDETLNKMVVMLANEMTKRIYGIHKEEAREEMAFYADQEEDHCLGELARLMTLSALYEDREEYEKCAAIKKHIDKINQKLDNYDA
jgi:hypothetical protein